MDHVIYKDHIVNRRFFFFYCSLACVARAERTSSHVSAGSERKVQADISAVHGQHSQTNAAGCRQRHDERDGTIHINDHS